MKFHLRGYVYCQHTIILLWFQFLFPLQRFSVSNAFLKKTRAFRVRNHNSRLTTKRTTLARLLESKRFTIGILIPTIYMLFIHDIVYACGPPLTKSLSATVGTLDLIVFLMFLVEIGCNIYAYRWKYTISSLFVLDAISNYFYLFSHSFHSLWYALIFIWLFLHITCFANPGYSWGTLFAYSFLLEFSYFMFSLNLRTLDLCTLELIV